MSAKYIWAISDTADTVYAFVVRIADGYLLNDADGDFASSPVDPYISLSEHSTIKGYYTVSESRVAWDEGEYNLIIYKQSGGSPAPVSDQIILAKDFWVLKDVIINEYDIRSVELVSFAILQGVKKTGISIESDLSEVKTDVNTIKIETHEVKNAIRDN